MGAPKTNADWIAAIAIVVAIFAGIAATLDTNSSASNDPWFIPVLFAALFTLCWY